MTNPIGPQRITPASPARIAAEVAETKRQISETRTKREGDAMTLSQVTRDAMDRFASENYSEDKNRWTEWYGASDQLNDAFSLAEEYAALHRHDDASPTREQFRALGAEDNFASLRLGRYLLWHHDADYPALVLVGSEMVELKTVGHLRAVCEILGVEWKDSP